ncbi:MAG TPA: redoxin domain-containing protein [Dokdonella sp.]
MNTLTCLVASALLAFVGPVLAKPVIGEAAPAFSTTDSDGRPQSLADYKGKIVVLEWNNPQCPFVRKHYGAGNMQAQQGEAAAAGVVWLSVNSGAAGKQGHLDAAAAKAWVAEQGARPAAYLLDSDGSVGRAYAAKTTPQIAIVDRDGILRYNGAIDSIPSADVEDIKEATQYARQALAEIAAGKPVSVATTEPYGCSVKYDD